MRSFLLMVLLLPACFLGTQTPKGATLQSKPPLKTEIPREGTGKPVKAEQEWCFKTTAVATTGKSYNSLVCLEETELCEQVNALYKKKGGLLGIEIIAECKARPATNAR